MTSEITLQRLGCLRLAVLALLKARWQVARHSEKDLAAHLVAQQYETIAEDSSQPSEAWLRDFSWALCGLARRVPFRADCLVRMLAAKQILQNRINFQVHLQAGVKDGNMTAHTWLSARGIAITGEPVAGLYALNGTTHDTI